MGENKIENLFLYSLENNELDKFILGQDRYYEPNREYGGHWPYGSYKNYIEPSLNNGVLPEIFWDEVFKLITTYSDKNILLDNLIGYFTPYYNCSDLKLKTLRNKRTPDKLIAELKKIINDNKYSLSLDKRGTGVEWNSKTGLLGSLISNLTIIHARGGPNFLPDEYCV